MKIDVRYKLLLFVLMSIAVFIAKDFLYGSILFAIVAAMTFCMGQWKTALRFIGFYLVLSAVAMLCAYLPALLAGIVLMIVLFLRMFLPLLFYARVFIATTTVSETVTALYALKMPRPFVITLAVAMRFFPTAKEELHRVRDAMRMRGLGLSFQNLITRPAFLLEGFMTPLMMRSSTIADELSAASITRGIDNPKPRTAFFRLKTTPGDTTVTILAMLMIAGTLAAKYGGIGR
jgi:energy-coupling factor transport system permease protein